MWPRTFRLTCDTVAPLEDIGSQLGIMTILLGELEESVEGAVNFSYRGIQPIWEHSRRLLDSFKGKTARMHQVDLNYCTYCALGSDIWAPCDWKAISGIHNTGKVRAPKVHRLIAPISRGTVKRGEALEWYNKLHSIHRTPPYSHYIWMLYVYLWVDCIDVSALPTSYFSPDSFNSTCSFRNTTCTRFWVFRISWNRTYLVHVHIYIYMYVHIYIYMCICMYVCMCVCMYVCMCVYVCMYVM